MLALNTVGGITGRFGPRVLACPDQLIDYTWGRISTLCEEPGTEVLHVDFGEPYTPALRRRGARRGGAAGVALVDGGCYGATQGPRLETRAEIARMRRDGCDLVGMTGMPEAGLARELGLDYACLAIVANWAAGAGPDVDEVITLQDVLDNVAAAIGGCAGAAAAPAGRLTVHRREVRSERCVGMRLLHTRAVRAGGHVQSSRITTRIRKRSSATCSTAP